MTQTQTSFLRMPDRDLRFLMEGTSVASASVEELRQKLIEDVAMRG